MALRLTETLCQTVVETVTQTLPDTLSSLRALETGEILTNTFDLLNSLIYNGNKDFYWRLNGLPIGVRPLHCWGRVTPLRNQGGFLFPPHGIRSRANPGASIS